MSRWTEQDSVNKYIEMRKNYTTSPTVYQFVKEYTTSTATLLELGSGPGIDAVKMNEFCKVTASDFSKPFIEYIKENTELNCIELNALDISLEDKYNVIFSNKVLSEFNEKDFIKSIEEQFKNLKKHGTLIHSLWLKNVDNVFDIPTINKILDNTYIDHFEFYSEDEENDSIIVALRRKQHD